MVIVVGRAAAERAKQFLWSRPDTRRSPPTRIWPVGDARVLRDAQRLVQVRLVENIPQSADHLAVGLRLICHPDLDRAQPQCEGAVAAVQQGGPDRGRPHELAPAPNRRPNAPLEHWW